MRWWVAFSDGLPRWWKPLLREGYGHCRAWCEVLPGVCIELNPAAPALEIKLYTSPPYDLVRSAVMAGETVVTIETESPYERARRLARINRFLTCASVIAYGINIDSWAITPWQLYRRVIKAGGVTIDRSFFPAQPAGQVSPSSTAAPDQGGGGP